MEFVGWSKIGRITNDFFVCLVARETRFAHAVTKTQVCTQVWV